jgi:hypothetical protein
MLRHVINRCLGFLLRRCFLGRLLDRVRRLDFIVLVNGVQLNGEEKKKETKDYKRGIKGTQCQTTQGLYTGQKSRRQVEELIRQRQTEELQLSASDFPLQCFSNKTVARLLNLSLKTEYNLFGEAWTEEQESEHRAGFAAALQKGNYCTIDTSKTLQDAGWQSFFRSLT